ncbi:hypothetical protein [Pseudomonas sp.]|uniref:hypothetical protein n=1 Tax=Pseudomonas sp. TaxID=306 RepID=UPI0026034018|nr:hypothetical protein [Pseudomonas sp.]
MTNKQTIDGVPVKLPELKDGNGPSLSNHRSYNQGWNAYAEAVRRLGPLFAAQPQGEVGPVAFVCDATTTHHSCPEGCGDTLSEWLPVGTELYAHADAGEVERLRADLASANADKAAYAQNAIDLRAQLAERDALLREASGWVKKNSFHGTDAIELWERIDADLYTSAETKPRGEAVAWKIMYTGSDTLQRFTEEKKAIEAIGSDYRYYAVPLYAEQPAPVAIEAAKAFAKGFNTLESGGGKYRINMQFQSREDAWGAFTALAHLKQLNTPQ